MWGRGVVRLTFRLGYTKSIEQFRMLNWKLNNLFDLLDLLVKTSHHLIGGVRHLLHHHEGHEGVHLVGQDLVQRVAVVTQSNPEKFR